MSEKELRRKTVFEGVLAKRHTLRVASKVLGLSYRQCRRSYKRFREQGDAGLVHRSRGRPSNRGKPARFKRRVLARCRERYKGFGPTLAAEKLAKEGLEVDHETLRRWMLADGLWHKRRHRAKHRMWRERRAHFGELVQIDGSHHRWFGGDRAKACLMDMVDDATGETLILLAAQETTEAAMRVLWQWIERYGIPRALYCDRKNVFITKREPTVHEQLAGETPLTAFGKACDKLGIKIIPANSPQAKGRVERKHGVFQDRLVKELHLRGIKTIATANRLLNNGFVRDLNAKFAIEPASDVDFHRPVPEGLDLADVFCLEETRVVQNDWTVQYNGAHYQILKENGPLPKPRDKVTVRIHLDKTMDLVYRDEPLAYRPIPTRQLRRRHTKASSNKPPRVKAKPTAKPHKRNRTPWRQNCTLMFADTDKGQGKP